MTTHRARNQREARKLALATAARVLVTASDAWEVFAKFEHDAEYERFNKAWERLVAELERRSEDR